MQEVQLSLTPTETSRIRRIAERERRTFEQQVEHFVAEGLAREQARRFGRKVPA